MNGNEIPEPYRAWVGEAVRLAQEAGYRGELNKIEAIRCYRQASGASLADAKRVVEMFGPLRVEGSGGGPQPPWGARPSSGGVGFLVNVLVLVAVGVGLAVGIIVVAQKLSRPGGSRPTRSAGGRPPGCRR